MSLSPRERISRVLKRTGNIDRIPWSLDFGASSAFTPGFYRKFVETTGITDPGEHFGFEVRVAHSEREDPQYHTSSSSFGLRMISNGITSDYFDPFLPEHATLTPWGVGLIPWPDNPGSEEMVHPLKNVVTDSAIREYPSPGIDEKSRPVVKKRVALIRERGLMSSAFCGSIYEWCHWLRGMEEFMIDLLTRPELAQALIDKVASFTHKLALAHAESGVELLCFYDDYGMQSCLQVNPDLWRQFFKPAWEKIIQDLKGSYPDCFFFLHSCGHIQEVIKDLIEVGFDCIHPLQPECQNPEKIIRQFGDRMSFWGTISVQNTLPFGTPEEIENVVRSRMELARVMPSVIVSPANTLGQEIPVENVLTYIEACRKHCET